jgi:hypothetical protein
MKWLWMPRFRTSGRKEPKVASVKPNVLNALAFTPPNLLAS